MSIRRRRVRGFTLVELMVVVSTVGVLSAIAIPRFTRMFKRSRQVEAYQTLGVLERCMTEFYNRNSAYPGVPAAPNPPSAGNVKAEMNTALAGWSQISFTPDGAYRWQYEFFPTAGCPLGHSCVTLHAYADTDNDGVVGHYFRQYDNGFRVDNDGANVDD